MPLSGGYKKNSTEKTINGIDIPGHYAWAMRGQDKCLSHWNKNTMFRENN
jgi:hypothetical protein